MIPDGQDAATALNSTFRIGVVAVETGEWEAEASVPERHTSGLLERRLGAKGTCLPRSVPRYFAAALLLCNESKAVASARARGWCKGSPVLSGCRCWMRPKVQ